MKAFKEFLAMKAKESNGKPLDSKSSKAKKEMLDHLSGLMKDHMSSGLKKVTVASDSPEGLEKGLEKAKEIVEKKEVPDMEDEAEDMSEEDSGEKIPFSDDSEEESQDEEMSAEEIDEMIKQLQEKKAKLA